ncbi:MAG: response regulator transcription factor [Sphaerochaetaceae bacterium]|nr:response regulator transcription factor [Sphaerochaetaceae bacterium]
MIRMIIADDHELIRLGIETVMSKDPEITIIGAASSVAELEDLLMKEVPQVLLLDISLEHRRSGMDFLALHKDLLQRMRVLILSMNENLSLVQEAVSLGAAGYLTKLETTFHLLSAIRTVAQGDLYLSPHISKLLLESAPASSQEPVSPVRYLTKKETLIFDLLGQGLTTREIAKHINITRSTVSTHVENIKFKLNINTIQELIYKALDWKHTQQEL